MNSLKASVVVPTYNGGEHLGEAIQSVLDQTYPNFELIIVDDASPESISHIIDSFTDVRLKYIRHDENKGAVAARKTGVRASSGDLIAFLDQDDLFHKQKLEAHLDYFLKNPEIGMTYNSRFEVQGSEKVLCGIYCPPVNLQLADWVTGFPVSPSDVVLKREWALRDEIWDDSFASQAEHVIFNGQEIVFGGRLALAGCTFGNVGRALNYRRYHPFRVLKHLEERCQAELACQGIIFSDARCPNEIRAMKDLAFSNIYVMWAYTAYIQQEFELGKKFLKCAMKLHPAFFQDSDPCQFITSWMFWISAGTVDHSRRHEEILRSVFENLPVELRHLKKDYYWADTQSFLAKGLRTLIWQGMDAAEVYLKRALEKGAYFDEIILNMVSDELLKYESEFGSAAAERILANLTQLSKKLHMVGKFERILGFYAHNRAFRNFGEGKFEKVPFDIARAVHSDFHYLLNRGVISILIRSLFPWAKARLNRQVD
jgi:glycosyltransferase involved in cell wall biosynthesis